MYSGTGVCHTKLLATNCQQCIQSSDCYSMFTTIFLHCFQLFKRISINLELQQSSFEDIKFHGFSKFCFREKINLWKQISRLQASCKNLL